MKKILAILLLLTSLSVFSSDSIVFTDKNSTSFNDIFYSKSVNRVMNELRRLDSLENMEKEPIYLVMNSGGGGIYPGLEFINLTKGLKRKVITVSHYAASMAFETVQSLGERYLLSNGILMSHKAKGFVFGEYPGQLDNRLAMHKRIVDLMEQVAVNRTNKKHNLKSYRELIENEFWCVDVDCIKEGFADKIISARCDESLNGKYSIKYTFLYEGRQVDIIDWYSKCPLQTNYLSYEILIDGQPLIDTSNYIDNKTVQSIVKKVQEIKKIRKQEKLTPTKSFKL